MIWSIDGIEWDLPCDISRVSEVTLSDISGMLLDKSYFGDVLGTYLKYSIKLVIPPGMEQKYYSVYEAITEPVDGHTFILPYNGGNVEITGRVSGISDVYVILPNGAHRWKGIAFDIISNHPSKTMELSDVITRGMTPLPATANFPDGTTASMVDGQWVFTTYEDADVKYY